MSGSLALRIHGRRHPVEIVFMDCDGVIFDVNAAKSAAFLTALNLYPRSAAEQLVAYHQAHGGVSRYDLFEYFFSTIHPVNNVHEASQHALQAFGEASRRGYQQLSPRPQALAFANRLGGPERVYVISGSDQQELRDVFAQHAILHHFADVCGSPQRKPAHMQRILQFHDCPPAAAVMIGDGRADFEAAQQLGMPFLFLAEMSEWADARELLRDAVRSGQAMILDSWRDLLALVD